MENNNENKRRVMSPYDKEKYREMTLDAAETVLDFLASIDSLRQFQ
jgi:hypothetical protein